LLRNVLWRGGVSVRVYPSNPRHPRSISFGATIGTQIAPKTQMAQILDPR